MSRLKWSCYLQNSGKFAGESLPKSEVLVMVEKDPELFKMFDSMENKSFKETETGTELSKVTANGTVKGTTTCTPEVCRSARQRFQPPDLANNSPWNTKKTYFFVGIIVIFVIWIIVYSIVSELKLV